MQYNTLSVGGKFPIDTSGSPVSIAFRDNQAMLILKLGGLKSREIRDVKSGLAQFAIYTQQDMMFFCFRFGIMPWMDCPYTIHLEKGGSYDFDSEVKDGQGYALQIYLVEAETDTIKVIRLIGLPTEMSRRIREIVLAQKQTRKLAKFECDMLVASIYNMLPTTAMVDIAKSKGDIW